MERPDLLVNREASASLDHLATLALPGTRETLGWRESRAVLVSRDPGGSPANLECQDPRARWDPRAFRERMERREVRDPSGHQDCLDCPGLEARVEQREDRDLWGSRDCWEREDRSG